MDHFIMGNINNPLKLAMESKFTQITQYMMVIGKTTCLKEWANLLLQTVTITKATGSKTNFTATESTSTPTASKNTQANGKTT